MFFLVGLVGDAPISHTLQNQVDDVSSGAAWQKVVTPTRLDIRFCGYEPWPDKAASVGKAMRDLKAHVKEPWRQQQVKDPSCGIPSKIGYACAIRIVGPLFHNILWCDDLGHLVRTMLFGIGGATWTKILFFGSDL